MIALVFFAVLIAATAVATGDPNKPLTVAGGIEIELGLDVGLGVIAALGYLVAAARSFRSLMWLLPAGYGSWIILAAGSRGAFAAGVLALIYLALRYARTLSRRHAALFAVALVGTTIGATVILGGGGLADKKYSEVLFSTNTDQILGLRGYLYRVGLQLAIDHPFGLGAGGFAAELGLNHPHDILLQLADEQGIPAVALFASLFVCAWRARRFAASGRSGPEAIVVGAFIIFLFIEALVSLDLNQDKPLWFFLGLAFALRNIRIDDQ
jgi:hypothetical protein